MLHGETHHKAAGHQRNWKTGPPNKRTRAVHARRYFTSAKRYPSHPREPIQPKQTGQRHGETARRWNKPSHTNVKSTNTITANSVLKAAKAKADAALKASSTTITPTITSRLEVQEEADHLNMINQLVIGAKEGVVEAVSKLVGSNITNAVLQTADGSNHKSIDDYTLFAVMAAAINGADQPSTTNVLEQLLKVINHTFDFQKKVSVNMELMQSNAARMATYGIAIRIP